MWVVTFVAKVAGDAFNILSAHRRAVPASFIATSIFWWRFWGTLSVSTEGALTAHPEQTISKIA
ncbi:hypothetical protein ACTJLC_21870 [Paraburkholderia sp. 22099]|nr:hypothetical protein [Paraburkholderia terricola]